MVDVDIRLKKLDICGLEVNRYSVAIEGSNKLGRAQFYLKKVDEECFSKEHYQLFLDRGIPHGKTIAFLDTLYPYGYPVEKGDNQEIKMRRGVGSIVLERMIRDALDMGLDTVCGITYVESAQRLYLKFDFEQYGKKNEFNIKVFNKKDT